MYIYLRFSELQKIFCSSLFSWKTFVCLVLRQKKEQVMKHIGIGLENFIQSFYVAM